MNAGYLWIEDLRRRQLVIHPLNGLIRIEGTPESFTLRARQLGRPGFTLAAARHRIPITILARTSNRPSSEPA